MPFRFILHCSFLSSILVQAVTECHHSGLLPKSPLVELEHVYYGLNSLSST